VSAYRLTGSRCRCAACGELFNSVSVFTRHRAGLWVDGDARRRCLAPQEMAQKGWRHNAAGFWIERRRVRARTDCEIRRPLIDRTCRSGDLGPAYTPIAGSS
jgi:hypothetical protein